MEIRDPTTLGRSPRKNYWSVASTKLVCRSRSQKYNRENPSPDGHCQGYRVA
jgi:hypothetical protein